MEAIFFACLIAAAIGVTAWWFDTNTDGDGDGDGDAAAVPEPPWMRRSAN